MKPFTIGDVEVVAIDAEKKTFNLLVTVHGKKGEFIPISVLMALPETQKEIQSKVKGAVNYLVAEGFLSQDLTGWFTNIGGVLAAL